MHGTKSFKIDFFGVGAPKAGTTWLARCLAEHPQICFSAEKETNFFNDRHLYYVRKWSSNYPRGMSWYENFYAHFKPGQKRGEFSVAYLYDNKAPYRIKKNFPDARIIIVLRNPVDFFYSHYVHARYIFDLPPLKELLASKFADYGFYSRYVEKYLRFFPRGSVLITLYDDIEKDPGGFLKKIYGFLQVDENFIPPSLHKTVNPSAPKMTGEARFFYAIRNKLLKTGIGKKMNRFPRLKASLSGIEIRIAKSLPSLSRRKKRYEDMPADIRAKLNEIYYPEILRLEKITGIDFGAWKEKMGGQARDGAGG